MTCPYEGILNQDVGIPNTDAGRFESRFDSVSSGGQPASPLAKFMHTYIPQSVSHPHVQPTPAVSPQYLQDMAKDLQVMKHLLKVLCDKQGLKELEIENSSSGSKKVRKPSLSNISEDGEEPAFLGHGHMQPDLDVSMAYEPL